MPKHPKRRPGAPPTQCVQLGGILICQICYLKKHNFSIKPEFDDEQVKK